MASPRSRREKARIAYAEKRRRDKALLLRIKEQEEEDRLMEMAYEEQRVEAKKRAEYWAKLDADALLEGKVVGRPRPESDYDPLLDTD